MISLTRYSSLKTKMPLDQERREARQKCAFGIRLGRGTIQAVELFEPIVIESRDKRNCVFLAISVLLDLTQEFAHHACKHIGLIVKRKMPGLGDHLEFGVWKYFGVETARLFRL